MQSKSYKDFSLNAHLGNISLGRPNSCQLELTYACGLRCAHCYLLDYNRREHIARELNTQQAKKVIDELKGLGVLWLCFTGGDPLVRKDFSAIYLYARRLGFLATVFTNGYSLKNEHIELFRRYPPFSIEITINAVDEALYEEITGVKGSFKKTVKAIELLRKYKLPLKLKAMVTKLNERHIPNLKKYAREQGLKLALDDFLHAGLNSDTRPLEYRLSPRYFHRDKKPKESGCVLKPQKNEVVNDLFPCVAPGGDGFQISPYGHISACCLIRDDDFNVLHAGVKPAFKKMLGYFRDLHFTGSAKCRVCDKRELCGWCPGKAYVETGKLDEPIDYCCKIAGVDNR